MNRVKSSLEIALQEAQKAPLMLSHNQRDHLMLKAISIGLNSVAEMMQYLEEEDLETWVSSQTHFALQELLYEMGGLTTENHPEVPQGSYCYSQKSRMSRLENGELGYHTTTCPHWDRDPDQPQQISGICRLLCTSDRELAQAGRLSNLWDKMKFCGINTQEEEEELEEIDLPSPEEYVDELKLRVN